MKQRSRAIHLYLRPANQLGGLLHMGISRFSLGTRLRWQSKTYEVRLSASVNTVALREILTEEETIVEMRILLKALFAGQLFFLPSGSQKKSRKQNGIELEEELRTLDDYSPHLATIARHRLEAIWPLLPLDPQARKVAVKA